MSPSSRPRLNQSPVLRYDTPHMVANDANAPEALPPEAEGSEHMDVNSIGSIGRAMPLGQPRPAAGVSPAAKPVSVTPSDEVEISSAGKMMDNLSRTSNLREERLAQIKAAIADGTYDTPEKFDAALERMLGVHGLSGDD